MSIKKTKEISELLRIRCSQCGACCSDPIIEVTHHDLKRLVKYTGMSADKLVKLYAKSDFNLVEDDEDFAELTYGLRKLALRKKSDGTCMFLSEDNKCEAYEARPMSCRIFPIDVMLDENYEIDDLELSDVIRDKFIKCKHHLGKPVNFKSFMEKARQSSNETASFLKRINKWNDRTVKGKKQDLLKYLGLK